MDLATLVALGTAAAALAVLFLGVLRVSHRLERELAASRADLAALAQRVEALTEEKNPSQVHTEQEYVITDLPQQHDSAALTRLSPQRSDDSVGQVSETPAEVTTGAFASLVLGESLVKAVAFGHGLQRALSPENRNRITFEMRREVKRSRKQRRRDLKQARRSLREDAA
jgi:hypothetical protein